MSRNISIRPQAIVDLNTHADYLSQQNTSVGFRFFDAARQTFGIYIFASPPFAIYHPLYFPISE